MRNDIDALTSLRGIAAVFVVLYHYTGNFLPNLDTAQFTSFVIKGYLWVDLFFLLSGFVIMHAYGDRFRSKVEWRPFKVFIFNRVARLYPLHLAMLAAFVLLELARAALLHAGMADLRRDAFDESNSLPALAEQLLMLQAVGLQHGLTWNGPAWSIGAEWLSYLVFPALAGLLFDSGWRCRLSVCLAAIVGLALISSGGRDLDVTYDFGALRCLFQFTVGAALYLIFRQSSLPWLYHDRTVVVAAGGSLGLMHVGATDLLLPPAFAVLVLSLAGNRNRVAAVLSVAPLRFLGAVSYSLYLSHMLVLEAIDLASRTLWGQGFGRPLDAPASVLALALLIPALLILSASLYRGVELPMRQRLKESRFARTYIYAPTAA